MTASRKPVVFCLVGPTAAGKTDVAIRLADRYPVDIVSVDSALVYRHMNIGTAKPTAALLNKYPHRLVDICDPWETYSAGRFRQDALNEIDAMLAQGRIPLLVGGTFLYFRALQQGLADLPTADMDLRAAIDARAEQAGWPALHAELRHRDPETADRIKSTDRQRIQRALEVIELTGERLSELQARHPANSAPYEFVQIALLPSDRAVLHERVETRFDAMLEQGFIAEVEDLRDMPDMHSGCTSMRSVGYRQLWSYLDGETGLNEARRQAIVATRRLVKRQLTWLRGEPVQATFDCLEAKVASRVAAFFSQRIAD